MDLCSSEAEHCYHWCREHLEEQPESSESLTWYVSASMLYIAYANAASRDHERVLGMNELWTVLRIMYPLITSKRLKNEGVFCGVRYYVDKVGGNLKFGV